MSLHTAARTGDLPAVKLVLSSEDGRAAINNPNGDGRAPLHYAAQYGYEGIVDLLIKKGANVNVQTQRHKYTPLILAAECGHQAVVKNLVRSKADVNLAGIGRNNTALHKAVGSKEPKILQYLLEHGAHPNSTDVEGRTPLGRAASKEDYPRTILLMGFGGKLAEKETQTLPAKLSKGLDLGDPATRIHWAVETGNNPTPIVRSLLATDDQLIKSTNARGWRLLHQAARVGNRDLVELLLNKDPESIDCLTRGGWTPLLLAAEKGHNGVLQLLVERRADTTRIPTAGNRGHTALWYAKKARKCTRKTVEMLEILSLSQQGNGAPPPGQDTEEDGDTPDSNSATRSEGARFDGTLSGTTGPSSVYDFFGELEKTWQNHFQFHEQDKIVKVAVLDTGINLNHPDFKRPRVIRFENGKLVRAEGEMAQSERINARGLKNFAVGRLGEDNVEDLDGHGTKVAGLILRLAPRAELYIARVCDGRESSEDSEVKGHQMYPPARTVAAALEWAIDQKVDIINMSFGFDQVEAGLLGPALRRAEQNNTLVFAAMSNTGPMRAAWPARHDQYAIGIHSYNAETNLRSSFTARIVVGNKNLMVPGEGVMTHTLRGPDFEAANGTSYATPIAAAMAALILAYVNQKGCKQQREEAKKLVDIDDLSRIWGMTKVLGSLHPPLNGYTLIPATLFWRSSRKEGSDKEDKRIAWDIIKRELSY